jgi:Fe-S cluster assembly iron-binding protein IscA
MFDGLTGRTPCKLKRGRSMLEVTEKASEKLKEYLEEQQIDSPIRIYVSHIG